MPNAQLCAGRWILDDSTSSANCSRRTLFAPDHPCPVPMLLRLPNCMEPPVTVTLSNSRPVAQRHDERGPPLDRDRLAVAHYRWDREQNSCVAHAM